MGRWPLAPGRGAAPPNAPALTRRRSVDSTGPSPSAFTLSRPDASIDPTADAAGRPKESRCGPRPRQPAPRRSTACGPNSPGPGAGSRRSRRPCGGRSALAALAALVALAYAATGTPAPAGGYVRVGRAVRRRRPDHGLPRPGRQAPPLPGRRPEPRRGRRRPARRGQRRRRQARRRPPAALGDRRAGRRSRASSTRSPSREQRQERALSAKLEEMIRPIDGVVSAHVIVNRPKAGAAASGPAPAATAFVSLETERDRELSSATVESIQGLIAGAVPEVKPDAVSVFDRKGRHYLDAPNPSVGAETEDPPPPRRAPAGDPRQARLAQGGRRSPSSSSPRRRSRRRTRCRPLPPAPSRPPPRRPPRTSSLPPASMSVNQPLELPAEVARARPQPSPRRRAPAAAARRGGAGGRAAAAAEGEGLGEGAAELLPEGASATASRRSTTSSRSSSGPRG